MIVAERFDLGKAEAGIDALKRFLRERNIDRTQIILAQAVQVSQGNSTFLLVYQDVSPPYVAGTSPANGSSGVPISSTINVLMSEPIADPSAAITITRNALDIAGTFAVVPVGGSWPDSAFRITGAINTTYNASYVVVLGSGITDAAGNPMGVDYVFSFTTADQASGLVFKSGIVTPTAGQIAAGFVTVTFGAAFADANYRVGLALSGGNAQPSVGLRIDNQAAGSFRIYFDPEDFSTVETGIDNADAALAAQIDTDHTTGINAQHANGAHAAPQNALAGLVTTPPGGAACADRAFQAGNSIEWVAIHGAPS